MRTGGNTIDGGLSVSKKKYLLLSTFSGLIIALCIFTPVMATSSPCGWASLPFTDPEDDVRKYIADNPRVESIGDYHDEIDVKSGFLSGADLVIEFCSPPSTSASYDYYIYIDTNSNNDSDYDIQLYGSFFFILTRKSDYFTWNGSAWQSGVHLFSPSINGNNLTLETVVDAIPNLAFAQIALVITMDALPDHYTDYVPITVRGATPIPGFSVVLALLALLGLVSHHRVRKRKI